LLGVLPYLIATGNLFSAASLFETYCLVLSKEVETRTQSKLSDLRGNGIQKLFKFLSEQGIRHHDIELREQVAAALKIRNCLIHCNGLLSWFREEKEVRKIIASKRYLSPEHRKMSRMLLTTHTSW
jgi:hypothetical protein